MEAPKRKITAKVNPDIAHSPASTRPPSQASNPQVSANLDITSLSPPAATVRPKAKVNSSATTGSLKVAAAKSSGSTITNGRKTPVSSVVSRAARDRPVSLIGTTTRTPTVPISQPASPMFPPSRRARSPQPKVVNRVTSPVPRTARRVKSPDPQSGRRLMSPSPPDRRVLSPSPTITRRATSPIAPLGRPRPSPARVPPLTIPRRGPSPTRSSLFNSHRGPTHRRVASASSVLSGSDLTPTPGGDPAKTRFTQSMSVVGLNRPDAFSATPPSPPRPADLALESPPPLPPVNPDFHLQPRDSSPEPTDSSTPPSAIPQSLLSFQNTNLVISSAPVTPTHVQTSSSTAPTRPRTSSITMGPSSNGITPRRTSVDDTVPTPPGMRITAKVTLTSTTNLASAWQPMQARTQQLSAPRERSGSMSGGSALSNITPTMVSGASTIRVSANSRILSPPPGRIPALGLVVPGSRLPILPAMQSPPSSLSSHSSGSQTSSLSRSMSYGFGSDRTRTPTDLGLRGRMSGGLGEDESVDRDDSGIDMFEVDDGDPEQGQREEARSNRKIADLEISNKSLLMVNAMLESTKARQAKEIRDLKRKLRESRLVLPPSAFTALEEIDPIQDIVAEGSAEDEDDSDENDVTQTQADETYARVRSMLDELMSNAKAALDAEPKCLSVRAATGGPSIRVLNEHEVNEYVGGQDQEEDSESELESIDGVSPLEERPPTPPPTRSVPSTPKYEGGGFSGLRAVMKRWT